MKTIILILSIIAATYYLKPDAFAFLKGKGAFDDQGNPATLVFVHNKCGAPCDDTLKFLKKRRVNYSLYQLDDNEENTALWKTYGGVNSFPNVIVGREKVYGSYQSRIVSALAMNYGDSVLTGAERNLMRKHFYDNGESKLVVYGASWCPYCKKLRGELNANNIDYIEIDVEKSAQRKSMTKTLEISGYPLVYFGYKRMDGPQPKDVLALF
jgi:glutaredoxin